MHENGPADCSGFCCCLEGAFGHRAEFRVSDSRLGKLVFGTPDKSGLPGAGSLVYIFICLAGVSEGLRKKNSLKAPLNCKKRVRRRRFVPRFPHFRLRERRSWRRVDLSMRELHELIELRELCRTAGSALEGHAGSALEGHGSVNRQSVASGLHGELLSCPCCICCVNDEDRVFYLKALRSSGPQMRGVLRPGASETLEPTMPDFEHVPSDDETSDIPAWGDLFPDDDAAGPDEDGPSIIPTRPFGDGFEHAGDDRAGPDHYLIQPAPWHSGPNADPDQRVAEIVEGARLKLASVASSTSTSSWAPAWR